MTVVRNEMNYENHNVSDTLGKRIIKAFDDTPTQTTETAPTVNEDGTPVETAEQSPAEKRAERRAAFKRAADIEARARQMEAQAKQKLAQAQRFEEVAAKANENPIEVAKALGMDPTEFLRKYQNSMFNIPAQEEPVLKPEEEVKQRLERYENERKEEAKRNQELQSQLVRSNYISNKILPQLASNKEKFELLNHNNIELSAGFIYDMMDAHYRATGEELNPVDVAEEMENQLLKELEEKLANARKVTKLSKYFREEVQEATQAAVKTPPAQLGAKSKTLSDSMGAVPTAPVKPIQRQRVPFADKQARIERVAQRLAEKEKI